MLDFIDAYLKPIGLGLGTLILVALNLKKVGAAVSISWSWCWRKVGRSRRMEKMLITLTSEFDEIKKDVSMLRTIESRRFREENHPEFLCDKNGKNIRVTEAYLDLLGLRNFEDLVKINWQNFIHRDDFEDYFEHFECVAKEDSDFRHRVRFLNRDGEEIGCWLVDAKRVNGHYLGRIKPSSVEASEIVEQFGWTY